MPIIGWADRRVDFCDEDIFFIGSKWKAGCVFLFPLLYFSCLADAAAPLLFEAEFFDA